ncbi:MAG: DinB family protein [Gemmatimonas sp.]
MNSNATPNTPPPLGTEVWQRGAISGFAAELQPVVHALMQVIEEIERHADGLTNEQLWARPHGVASVGFHLVHLAGSTDRLFTYARDERLSSDQKEALELEQQLQEVAPINEASALVLVERIQTELQRLVDTLRTIPLNHLQAPRFIGRARLETTTWGLLFHAAEHASRHAGQLTTTAKIVRGMYPDAR